MKKEIKIAIACLGVAIAVLAVLFVTNPFGLGENSEVPNPDGHTDNNPEPDIDDEGEITNPDEGGSEATFRISPGKVWWHDGEEIIETIDSIGQRSTYIAQGTGAYVAGEARDSTLTIWNLNDYAATFSVDYRVPDNVIIGYHRPTSEVRDWVWISDRWPTIPAHGKMDIIVRLSMPTSAVAPGYDSVNDPHPKWEFWIAVIDQSQTGWLKIEVVSRFLITMR